MAFKMKGSSFYGHGNQSPAKAKPTLTPEQQKKARYVEMSKEHEGKPGFKEARDKAFGGETTVEGSVSTVTKPSKTKSPAPFIGAIAKGVGKVVGKVKKATDKIKGAFSEGKEEGESPAKQIDESLRKKYPHTPYDAKSYTNPSQGVKKAVKEYTRVSKTGTPKGFTKAQKVLSKIDKATKGKFNKQIVKAGSSKLANTKLTKQVLKQGVKKATKKGIGKVMTKVATRGAGRAAGGPAVTLAGAAYGAYKSGQKHSGGRVGYIKNPNYKEGGSKFGDQSSTSQFMPKKKGQKHTSIWDKKK